MRWSSSGDDLNTYIALALIAGIIVALAVSFYYEFEIAGSPANDQVIAVVTVTATKIVYVNASITSTCVSVTLTAGRNSSTLC